MRRSVQISGGFLLLVLWFAAVNGWRPLLTVLCAAAIHEGGHWLTLRLLGADVSAFRLTLFGMELRTDSCAISYEAEILAVLAGPAANLISAAGLCAFNGEAHLPLIGANAALCAFNLLPIRFLDGGRALELLCCWILGPAAGERALCMTGAVTALFLAAVLFLIMWDTRGSLWLLPPALGMLAAVRRELAGE